MTHFNFAKALSQFKTQVDWVGFRYHREKHNDLAVRNENPEFVQTFIDQGLMIEVLVDGHIGYSATSDLSPEGLQAAFEKAKLLSKVAAQYKVSESSVELRPASRGAFESPRVHPLDALTLEEVMTHLLRASKSLKVSDKIVSRSARAELREVETQYLSSNGAEWEQSFHLVATTYQAVAQDSKDSQTRSDNGGVARSYQIGAEHFRNVETFDRCQTIGEEALELLESPNCPTDIMDLLLSPDQMMLQIHESIGHPLELDRILGDERNFAGWSFVKPADFGQLQYGSDLLNVVFDPSQPGQFASYAFDDVGNPATKEYLIKKGKLLRGLGSLESQQRLGIPGVANARSSSWNRAPIDRMANINILPGNSELDDIIRSVKRGLFMKSNRSWSIDDYRNKFQFSCEYAQLIEDGQLTTTVKNPNYRGQTLDFWRKLKAVSNAKTYETYGTPYCGKGEPSQIIRVGHGSPYCLFSQVEVFGGLS